MSAEPNPAPRRGRWWPNRRIAVVAGHDVVMAAASFELAVWLRYLTYGAPQDFGFLWPGTLLFAGVCFVVFWAMGLYRGIWLYASMTDLLAILRAVTLALLIFLPLMFLLTRLEALPRSAIFINWPILVLLLAGPRLIYRYLKDGNLAALFDRAAAPAVPVLLVGAGDQAESFIREMGRGRLASYRVVGIVDDKPGRIGRDIRGVRVLGDLESIDRVVADLEKRGRRPQRAIIASGKIDGTAVRALLSACDRLGLPLSRAPRPTDFTANDGDAGPRLRPIELEDLLGRPQRVLDRAAMAALIAGKRVLITGAGGTIGGELSRQVAALGPAQLSLLDNGEYNLYRIELELAEGFAELPARAILADVRDRARMDAVFHVERPDIVFHAAAFKHVPIVEMNPREGVLTNVGGTVNVAELAAAHDIEAMVLISTDKAVHPSSVMGASKRIAELICQGLSLARQRPRFVTVRFGNVLGSTGSVVPLFQRQLARGGPLTVTDPRVTRYFMTTREAVELVLQASAAGVSGAGDETRGKIHVLDMGAPVRIDSLARQMIQLAGLKPGEDVEIVYTGLRPGEKIHESLFLEDETLVPTALDGIALAAPRAIDYDALIPRVRRLLEVAGAGNRPESLALIAGLVPEYRPDEAESGDAARG